MTKYLITICARGGSKGIPGKNIKALNGKPLIAYTIETARKFSESNDALISLSTDDEEIRRTAAASGLQTDYRRPAELAGDKAGKIAAIRHLKNYEERRLKTKFDFIIDLDVTSPLRSVEDLTGAVQLLANDEAAHNIFSVSAAGRNPYYNMVELKEDGYVSVVKKTSGLLLARQMAPVVYDMNASFYIFRPSFFAAGFESSITEKSLAYQMPHLCFDLDKPFDFKIMELILREGVLDFEL